MTGQPQPGSWGWDEQELRTQGLAALELAVAHLSRQRESPVFAPVPITSADRWRSDEWADDPTPAAELFAEIEREVMAYPLGNGDPRFAGWVNGPPDRGGVLATMLSAALDPSVAGGNHAGLHLERQVLRWLADTLGMPAGSGGILVSGASMATIVALGAARQRNAGFDVRAEGLAGGPRLLVYTSAEAHSCVTKAAHVLGLGDAGIRLVPTTADRRLDPGALAAAIDADVAAGLGKPIAVVASAGTVNTGVIDPLADIADVCAEWKLWLHVDGAYGAPAVLTDRYRDELAALGRADSVATDAHKWLYVPVDAGVLLVRDPEALRAAYSLVPHYLQVTFDPTGMTDAPWMSEYGLEQTRPLRALRIWTALRLTGRSGYRDLIDHDLDIAAYLADRVSQDDRLELVAHGLSVVCFRRKDCIGVDGQPDRHGALAAAIQLGGEAFITVTNVDSQPALRACYINPLTATADVDGLIQLVLAIER
jgi:aromatic-L-amino-acid decarboxylase